MDSQHKVIVVTGCNKGIGYALVKKLYNQTEIKYEIIMACRSLERANEAVEKL